MRRLIRPLAVFGVASAVSLTGAVQLAFDVVGLDVAGTRGGSSTPVEAGAAGAAESEHDLSRLKILERTLYYVEENYAEPSHVSWPEMYSAALAALETHIPGCMFTREPEGRILSIEIDDYKHAVEIGPLEGRADLLASLRELMQLLEEHLDVSGIPLSRPDADPWAEVEYALVNGVLGTLDPHTVLLPPEDANEMDLENQGEFGGLGITIGHEPEDPYLVISSTSPETPARSAGLRKNDRILRIDGESTLNMSIGDAIDRLRGPAGAPVDLEVQRPGVDELLPIRVVRDLIPFNPVFVQLLEGDVGFVRISAFHDHVGRDLDDGLARLHRDSVSGQLRGVIVDLRYNPGGFLNQAVAVTDTFLERGNIVSTIDGRGRKGEVEDAKPSGTEPSYPVVVLVNSLSASASEIVAGALRNNDRAVIIGQRTFGKGSVQYLHDMFDHSKLKITISKYLTPGDRSIQSVGIPADIELRPVEIGTEGRHGMRRVAMFDGERAHREGDLEGALDPSASSEIEEPAYVVGFLDAPDSELDEDGLPNLDHAAVNLARQVILAAPSWRRGEILASVTRVVAEAQRRGEDDIERGLAELGIDWRNGPAAPRDDAGELVSVRFDAGSDGVLVAGTREVVGVEVTNVSDRTLYRVAAVALGHELLEPRGEFFFGRLEPGQTRRYEVPVRASAGFAAERSPFELEIRDAGPGVLATWQAVLTIQERPLPQLVWRWRIDDTAFGDGDGIADSGERLRISLSVRNRGDGPTGDTIARLTNRSRAALDLVQANLRIGHMVDEDGERCEPLEPGIIGDKVFGDAHHARVGEGRAPVWAEGCRAELGPAESWDGSFLLDLKGEPEGGRYELQLTLADSDTYDHTAVARSGFVEYHAQEESLGFELGGTLPGAVDRQPPAVQITRKPDVVTSGNRATLSGVVTDDGPIANVMVFAGGDKVFFAGSNPEREVSSVPFTADIDLVPGLNTITVLAADRDGFLDARSVVTYSADAEVARLFEVE